MPGTSRLQKVPDPVHVRFGQLVRMHRAILGLSQVELSMEAGMATNGAISYWEHGGGVTLKHALHLAWYLGISLDRLAEELYGQEGDKLG